MRLTAEQVSQFHLVLKSYWKEIPYTLFLYGSRAHDNQKGGDIDLLIITTHVGIEVFKKYELELLVNMKKQSAIGQRRIDLKAATQENLQTDAFLRAISNGLVELR